MNKLLLLLIAIALLLDEPETDHPPTHPSTIAFVGDSLTLGALSTGYVGFAGMTARDLRVDEERFVFYHLADTIVLWDEIVQPDIIVIELGVHSVVGCDHLTKSEARFQQHYGKILDLAKSTAPRVYAINIPWLAWSDNTRVLRYNELIAAEAADRNIQVVDAWSVTVDCQECIGSDGFHLNDVGHRAIANELKIAIKEQALGKRN